MYAAISSTEKQPPGHEYCVDQFNLIEYLLFPVKMTFPPIFRTHILWNMRVFAELAGILWVVFIILCFLKKRASYQQYI